MFNNPITQKQLKPYFTFKYLMLALTVVFFVRHGMRIDIHIGQNAIPEAEVNVRPKATDKISGGPTAKFASFKPPLKNGDKEVLTLRMAYINTYAPIAKVEMKDHGIPASITLAQGLLESVAGTSKLATITNNHFGIKCFKRSCSRGHCRNFEDDHHKDFFRNYKHAEDSYRAHSDFLVNGNRYKKLFKLSPKDYKGWAKGLKQAGYATDPKYADKLISLIERYKLAQYDL